MLEDISFIKQDHSKESTSQKSGRALSHNLKKKHIDFDLLRLGITHKLRYVGCLICEFQSFV